MSDVLCHLATNTYTPEATTYTRKKICHSSGGIHVPMVWNNRLLYAHMGGDSRTFNMLLGSTKADTLRICIDPMFPSY